MTEAAEAHERLIELCWNDDGQEGLDLALAFDGPAVAQLQMLAMAESIVGERRGDLHLIRSGTEKFERLDEIQCNSYSAYNIAHNYAAIWRAAQQRLGLAQALLDFSLDSRDG